MSDDETRELIQELARDLTPVRPIASLRVVGSAVLGLWLAVAALGVLALGLQPKAVQAMLSAGGVGLVFAGLATGGLGGIVSGLALGVPGRERLARAALVVGGLGLALAAGVATLLVLRTPGGLGPFGSKDLTCLGVACAVGLLPALGVVLYVGRAAPFRPGVAVIAAACGAAALGSLAAEASCSMPHPFHLLVAHALAPVAGVLVLTLPLLWVMRRL